MSSAQKTILSLLNEEFAKIQKRNPSFSLRAYAKRLGLDPSALSRILAEKIPITRKSGEIILTALGIPIDAQEKILKDLKLRDNTRGGTGLPRLMDLDQAQQMSDWVHLSILALAQTRDYQPDPEWIAARLNTTPARVEAALQSLLELGMMKPGKKGPEIAHHDLELQADPSDPRSINLIREGLKQALSWLDETGEITEGDFSTVLAPAPLDQLTKMRPLLCGLRWKLRRSVEAGSKTEVYKIGLQILPVSRQ